MAFKLESNTTHISNIFIDYYMAKAQPAYVLAYLYAYRHVSSGNTALSDADVAKALNMIEGDVIKAWDYWASQGLIRRHEDGAVEFLTVEPPKAPVSAKKEAVVIVNRQPEYSPMELSRYLESSETVKELFLMGQTHLGKLLSHNDMSVLFGFYDWLRLPLEVIEVLLVYAVKNNHRSLNYIEKIAINWAEEGIDDPQKAMDYIKKRSKGNAEIIKAFGISGRALLPAEEIFVKKWIGEYNMPTDLIVFACEKTVLQTGKISFPYADTIITKWKEAKIFTKQKALEEEKKYQEAGRAKREQIDAAKQKNVVNKPNAVKQSRFVNFEQRKWDFDELERLERERRRRNIQNDNEQR